MGYLRKANLKDLNYVCTHMRQMDRLEALYQTGQDPEDALRLTYLSNEQVLTIAGDKDQPMGLCGVCYDGCIWMLATDELFDNKKYRIQLIRQGKEWVNNLLKNYNLLYNMVYAENHSAIKWLRCLGFTFINYHAEYGQQSKPFYEFMRIA